ncbi:MAG: hypothetical protein LUD02_13960 [Tannerellaceae bacterium]|nr:hypothetical protein [Tannerellaceae bacterium]
MKKSLFTLVLCLPLIANAQLPYSKLLSLTPDELTEGNFKYNKDRNQYVLKKSNGLNNTANVLNALGGQTADIKPHPDDYVITRQEGENEPAYLSVTFYKDDTFHEIEAWIASNDIDFIETNSGKVIIQRFNYEDYLVELIIEKVGVVAATRNTAAAAKAFDESYNIYTYNISTGVAPHSKWHAKQQGKKEKRDEKGKKKNINELM